VGPAAKVVYIGKAAVGTRDVRGLATGLDEYRRHGADLGRSHDGGRYLWHVRDNAALVVVSQDGVGASVRATERDTGRLRGAVRKASLRQPYQRPRIKAQLPCLRIGQE
jgi:2-polyprenyl-6-methoxyphenol hydroxylase-like FAD-dependent oxidoreductase